MEMAALTLENESNLSVDHNGFRRRAALATESSRW
jgi:hypothetical protein